MLAGFQAVPDIHLDGNNSQGAWGEQGLLLRLHNNNSQGAWGEQGLLLRLNSNNSQVVRGEHGILLHPDSNNRIDLLLLRPRQSPEVSELSQ